ncbi:MAG: hypothetical protein Fur0037_00950 [Planctomycetota bacterium]
MKRAPWILFLLAAAARWIICARTPVPGRDGVSYLWMAQEWARGNHAALFETVFHPLYPLSTGLLLTAWPGLDIVAAGQIVSAGTAAVAAIPLWYAGRAVFGEPAASLGVVFYALGTWFVRHPAECLSEGPFYLWTALWAAALFRSRARPALAGAAAGLAFLTRPEGISLAGAGFLFLIGRGKRRSAAIHAGAAVLGSAVLPLCETLFGPGFTLTPKASFNWRAGAGGSPHPLLFYLGQWLRLPGDALEGLGYAVFPLMLLGVWRAKPGRISDPRLALALPFAVQCLVAPLLKSHHRFVSGPGLLLLPFAGEALHSLLGRHVRLSAPRVLACLLLLAGSEARLWLDPRTDRRIERDLGRLLGRELRYGETLASDMPRLVFFAGRKPPPPRPIGPAEILMEALDPNCRFVVLRKGRTPLDSEDLAILGLEPREVPALLSSLPGASEIRIHQRPDRR